MRGGSGPEAGQGAGGEGAPRMKARQHHRRPQAHVNCHASASLGGVGRQKEAGERQDQGRTHGGCKPDLEQMVGAAAAGAGWERVADLCGAEAVRGEVLCR